MSNIDTMDLIELEDKKVRSIELPLTDLLCEWEDLVEDLTEKEIEYYYCKERYQSKADVIIAETDFKALYGANNQKVRDNHVKNELSKDHLHLKNLEFSIDWLNRRISFLRELIRTKRTILEVEH